MAFVAVAAAGIGAGAGLIGAKLSSNAAKNAAETQADAANRATDLQKEIYYNDIARQQPWYEAGNAGLNQLMALSGFTQGTTGASGGPTAPDPYAEQRQKYQDFIDQYEAKFTASGGKTSGEGGFIENFTGNTIERAMYEIYKKKLAELPAANAGAGTSTGWQPGGQVSPEEIMKMDPGYQFRLSEGLRGVESTAAAKGGVLSGGTQKALERYRQGYASNEYGNVWNRLANIAGIGQTATQQMGALGQNYANNAGDMMTQAANARASGYVGSSNAWTGAINGIGQNLMDIWANSRNNSSLPAVSDPYTGDFTSGLPSAPAW